ncbi:MAG: cysteine hydrolase family protein, partial [Thermoplasmataceae archaeon]
MSNAKRAFIAVDLVNDFITGKFGSERAEKIVSMASEFLHGRNNEIVVFTIDSHIKNDPEFRIWGEHCLDGEIGSQLHESLQDIQGHRIKKRHYDAFYDSDLDGYLRAMNVKNVFIFGIS